MIKILSSIDRYMTFIYEVNSDPHFSEPMLSNEKQLQHNLLDTVKTPQIRWWVYLMTISWWDYLCF